MTSFASHPCFDLKAGITTRGIACSQLSEALKPIRGEGAQEARRALGDPFLPERSSAALKALEALPERIKQRILAADQGKRLKDAEARA